MNILPSNIHSSWNNFLTPNIIKEISNIEKEIGNNYFPNHNEVLRFLNLDLKNIKCIIVGMEPYPTDFNENNIILPIATGRSFEVRNLRNKTWSEKFKQSSLRNILKTIYYNETGLIKDLDTIRKEIENGYFKIKQPAEWYDNLEKNGVLFLNATLTVEKYKVDSHTKIWETFMIELIKYIEKEQNPKWLLWGNKAQERIIPILETDNFVCTVHPRIASFVNENCFKHIKEINWLG